MALVTRTISNVGDALVSQDGTALSGIEISFLLVDAKDIPTDSWDVITGERVTPIKETIITNASGEFSVSLWPNDRGDIAKPTFYRCTVKSRDVQSFCAALPSGATSLAWIDFYANSIPLSSEIYGTPLLVTEGQTVPVYGVMTSGDGLPPVVSIDSIVWEITDTTTTPATVDYPAIIISSVEGTFSVDLHEVVAGRYIVRQKTTYTDTLIDYNDKFILVVSV